MKKYIFAILIFYSLISVAQPFVSPYPDLDQPLGVYITWAAHDELSDTIKLTEELAMKELDAVIRLKQHGAKIDYFLMDMFWFDKESGYREFKKEGWPNGPDKWINACLKNNIKPGLWLSTNVMGWNDNPWMTVLPQWEESAGGWLNLAMSLNSGNFLDYHIETMQRWYDKGIRMFKFDFASFEAASETDKQLYTPQQIREINESAWLNALKKFRLKNPDVVLLAYNGYGGDPYTTSNPFTRTVDTKWLEVFESLYCGDPRPSDVPCMNFWRSKDIYSDHMVFQYRYNGIPIDRIDNSSFMIGNTGTCYKRGKQAWKGMLILSGARGGKMNTYYGNLDLLDNEDMDWFSRTQRLMLEFQEFGRIDIFGGIPGEVQPYGYAAENLEGSIYTVVNPSQINQKVALPLMDKEPGILFSDSGMKPILEDNSLLLGPEQMVLIGTGKYNQKRYLLGTQDDVKIPVYSKEIPVSIEKLNDSIWKGKCLPSEDNYLRIIVSLSNNDKLPVRITGGELKNRVSIAEKMMFKVFQNGVEKPYCQDYNKKIWSGLSWVAGELPAKEISGGQEMTIEFFVDPKQFQEGKVTMKVYEIKYQ